MFKVRNVYSNHELRNHVSLEIRKCDKSTNPNCKDKDEIDDFLSEITFQMFNVKTFTDFNIFKKLSLEIFETHTEEEEDGNEHSPTFH